jgi:hypothetical protein
MATDVVRRVKNDVTIRRKDDVGQLGEGTPVQGCGAVQAKSDADGSLRM